MQRKGFFTGVWKPFIHLNWDFCPATPPQVPLVACQHSPFEQRGSTAAGPWPPSAVRLLCSEELALTQAAKPPQEILPGPRTCWREPGLLAAQKCCSKRPCSRGRRGMRHPRRSRRSRRGASAPRFPPGGMRSPASHISTFATSRVKLVGLEPCKLGASR